MRIVIFNDRWAKEVTSASEPLATSQKRTAFFFADLNVAQVLVELTLIDNRADLGARFNRRADLEALGTLEHRLAEAVINLRSDNGAARSGAPLACGKEGAIDGSFDSHVEVGVIQNHQRVFAAHFKLIFLEIERAMLGNQFTGLCRTGKADGINGRMFY